jgi:hypothetical protein
MTDPTSMTGLHLLPARTPRRAFTSCAEGEEAYEAALQEQAASRREEARQEWARWFEGGGGKGPTPGEFDAHAAACSDALFPGLKPAAAAAAAAAATAADDFERIRRRESAARVARTAAREEAARAAAVATAAREEEQLRLRRVAAARERAEQKRRAELVALRSETAEQRRSRQVRRSAPRDPSPPSPSIDPPTPIPMRRPR